MEKKSKEAISAEERATILNEVQTRGGGVSIKDVMSKHGRTEQTYYFWKRQAAGSTAPKAAAKRAKAAAPAMATKRAKSSNHRAKASAKSSSVIEGVLMPEGRRVRIHKTETDWAIVTFE